MQEDTGWIDSGSCKSGGHCGEPVDAEGPGTSDIHPNDRTTKHNRVQNAAVDRIRQQAKALGLKNFTIEEGKFIRGASKKCADANWNQIADCNRYGFADIVLTVEICATPEQCHIQMYVWEVKAFSGGKGVGWAHAESEWYARHLQDPENSVFADRGWDIGGPYKGDVAGFPNTSYWGGKEGAVVYGDDDRQRVRNHLKQEQDRGSLSEFDANDDKWAKWRQPTPPPSAPNVKDKPPAPGAPIPPPILILPRLPVPLR